MIVFFLLNNHLLNTILKQKVDYLYDITLGIKDVNGMKPCLSQVKNGIPLKGQCKIKQFFLNWHNQNLFYDLF